MAFAIKNMLKKELNLGEKDIYLRRTIGIGLSIFSVVPGSVPMLIIGVYLISSATSGWCPVYSTINKNTN
ncbi:MAG: DUF2892 domain-containing protein [Gammaproteobacteria bacterium]|nr:DUF2892 domain-containing protein [Gammaproteobacteria bacterium]